MYEKEIIEGMIETFLNKIEEKSIDLKHSREREAKCLGKLIDADKLIQKQKETIANLKKYQKKRPVGRPKKR